MKTLTNRHLYLLVQSVFHLRVVLGNSANISLNVFHAQLDSKNTRNLSSPPADMKEKVMFSEVKNRMGGGEGNKINQTHTNCETLSSFYDQTCRK